MFASLEGHVEVVDMLLQHGAMVDMQEKVKHILTNVPDLHESLLISNPYHVVLNHLLPNSIMHKTVS